MNKLSLFYPVKPFWAFQGFGANEACVKNGFGLFNKRAIVSKVDGVCPPNFSELYPQLGMKGHTGLDCQVTHGQNLYSCVDGRVAEISTEIERGMGVDIITKERFHFAEGFYYAKVRYWHLMSVNVIVGQELKAGDFIGQADNTGISGGDHLHFELKPVLFNYDGIPYNVLQSNEYYGAVDPTPYFNGHHAQDAQMIVGILRQMVDILSKIVNLKKSLWGV